MASSVLLCSGLCGWADGGGSGGGGGGVDIGRDSHVAGPPAAVPRRYRDEHHATSPATRRVDLGTSIRGGESASVLASQKALDPPDAGANPAQGARAWAVGHLPICKEVFSAPLAVLTAQAALQRCSGVA